MALIKKITLDSGVVTNYHMINNISISPKKRTVTITVDSYLNESIRDIEKEELDREKLIKELQKRLENEMAKNGEEFFGSDEFKDLDEQLTDLTSKQTYIDRALVTEIYTVESDDYKETYTLADGYEFLKGVEKFKNAKEG